MDDRLERIENKLDKVVDQIGEINETTAKQQVSLEYHIKRTDLLEKKLEPVEAHVSLVSSLFKIISGIAVLAGIIEVILQVMDHANK
jgi:archaellum component FlaC